MLTKRKPVKKIAFTLSVVMFVVWSILGAGTSLAWFSDSSETVKNIINVAEFDLQAFHKTETGYEPIDSASDIFKNDALYEPGYIEIVYLKVVNNGTVPFHFRTAVAIKDYRTAINESGEEFKLQDYLQYGLVFADTETELDSLLADRTQAAAIANKAFDNYTSDANLLDPAAETYIAIVISMPTNVNNVANYRDTNAPMIELMLIVTAEQLRS